MNIIRFSHVYEKMPANCHDKSARLIFVHPIELEKQTPYFLKYDTKILNEYEFYELPSKGKYILLGFDCDGVFFTTIRRHTEQKFEYYNKLVGMNMQIVIEKARGKD